MINYSILKRGAVFLCAAFICGLLGCSLASGNKSPNTAINNALPAAALSLTERAYTSEETDAGWDEETAVKIQLNGSSISVSGDGAKTEGNTITIEKAGTYVVSGTLENGRVVVEAPEDAFVKLVLNGAEITCFDSAPIEIKSAQKTVISLAENTENRLTDGTVYQYTEADADEPDAVIFSKDDLIINGLGKLKIQGQYKNGIKCKDDLVITAGDFEITAVNHGIVGRDSVSILSGSFKITTGNDGIKSTNDKDAEKGYINLNGGDYQITAEGDGIQAETSMLVTSGTFEIKSGGGSSVAPQNTPAEMGRFQQQETVQTEEVSRKGIKAGAALEISGGSFVLDCYDDALHTNGSASILGGDFQISTGDDGIHADEALVVKDGTILIKNSYEGLEGKTIDITGGDIKLTASDDGVNAASGESSAPGQAASGCYIRISGGLLSVDAAGDGLDSNGDCYIEGGVVTVNGPTSGGDGALDFDGKCTVTGGVLLASGSAGMAQTPDASSTQNTLFIQWAAQQQAGTLISIADSAGKTLAAFQPQKSFQTMVISIPELEANKTYTVSSGGNCTNLDKNGYSSDSVTDAALLFKYTQTEAVMSLSDSGEAVQMRGGGMRPGGGGPGGEGGPGNGMGHGGGQRPDMAPPKQSAP